MTYEQALQHTPATLEEAMEKAFWRAAGRNCLGAGLPETWEAVASAAREFLEPVAVAGSFDRPIAGHIRACLVLVEAEQRKVAPDNHIVATLCDSVRLAREYVDAIRLAREYVDAMQARLRGQV